MDKRSDDHTGDMLLVNKARIMPLELKESEISDVSLWLKENPAISVLAYCMASISMTVINKFCISGKHWNLNFFYLAVQSMVCIAAILMLKWFGIIKTLAGFNVQKAKKWLPISLLLVGMIYTSLQALQFLSVPVYTIFKNLTIIVIAYGEVLWFGGSVSSLALLSFALMVSSSVVAAWADIQYALRKDIHDKGGATADISTLNVGYAWMGLNVFCTAAYLLGMRKVMKNVNFRDWDTMFYNNLLTIPILLVCSLVTENWSSANVTKNFPETDRNNLILAITYSGLGTILISYASAWCIRVTSPTTYSMIGALNKLPIAITGFIFFNNPITLGGVSAIFIGFISGVIYAWAKVRQSALAKMQLP